MYQVIAKCHASEKNAHDRINQTQKYNVARHRHEILDTFGEHVFEIGRSDPTDDQRCGRLPAPTRIRKFAIVSPELLPERSTPRHAGLIFAGHDE